MLSFSEFKHAGYVFLLIAFGIIALVIPWDQVFPSLSGFIPAFLHNKSILFYLQEHTDFFISLLAPIILLMAIIYLWSKR